MLVAVTKPLGNQHLDIPAQQFRSRVAEQALGLGVDEHDLAVAVCLDDHHRVGSGLEQAAEPRLRRLMCLLGDPPSGDVGQQHREAPHLPVIDVGDVGHLHMAGLAVAVDDRPIEQLRLAGEGALDVRVVLAIEVRSDHLADMPTDDLIRRGPEELDIRAISEAVAQVGAVIADHRRQRIEDRSGVLHPGGRLAAAAVAGPLGPRRASRRVWSGMFLPLTTPVGAQKPPGRAVCTIPSGYCALSGRHRQSSPKGAQSRPNQAPALEPAKIGGSHA